MTVLFNLRLQLNEGLKTVILIYLTYCTLNKSIMLELGPYIEQTKNPMNTTVVH